MFLFFCFAIDENALESIFAERTRANPAITSPWLLLNQMNSESYRKPALMSLIVTDAINVLRMTPFLTVEQVNNILWVFWTSIDAWLRL